VRRFNPFQGISASATGGLVVQLSKGSTFQSLPGNLGFCDATAARMLSEIQMFQSLPGSLGFFDGGFNLSPQPKAYVSIPSRESRLLRREVRQLVQHEGVRFNPFQGISASATSKKRLLNGRIGIGFNPFQGISASATDCTPINNHQFTSFN